MARVLKPLPEGKGASRRSPSGDGDTAGSERPHLVLLRPEDVPYEPLHRGMWHDDPMLDETRYTMVSDWPTDEEFSPLIEAALAAGDHALAETLEQDRAFCARARATLEARGALSRHTSA